jgi:hypothetical protein
MRLPENDVRSARFFHKIHFLRSKKGGGFYGVTEYKQRIILSAQTSPFSLLSFSFSLLFLFGYPLYWEVNHSPDWERLKVKFLHYYDADQEDNNNRPLDLVRFVEENKQELMESLGAWLKYYRDYMTMATPLVNNETLSDRHYKTLFWMGIPDDLQCIFEFRLQATIKTYTPHDPYTIEEVAQLAEQHFECNKFTEMFFNAPRREPQYNSSDTDSDYADHRRGRRSQCKPKYSRRKKSKAKDRNYSPEPHQEKHFCSRAP